MIRGLLAIVNGHFCNRFRYTSDIASFPQALGHGGCSYCDALVGKKRGDGGGIGGVDGLNGNGHGVAPLNHYIHSSPYTADCQGRQTKKTAAGTVFWNYFCICSCYVRFSAIKPVKAWFCQKVSTASNPAALHILTSSCRVLGLVIWRSWRSLSIMSSVVKVRRLKS